MDTSDDAVKMLKEDFKKFAGECMGILLFGSYAEGRQNRRSDIDVCIVRPHGHLVDRILRDLGGKYDLKVFEELPLYIQVDIIDNHIPIYANDEMNYYFYKKMKIWKDMERRIEGNKFKSIDEKMELRKRWLCEKKKILREIGMV